MTQLIRNQKASILIMVLWALTLLAVFAVQIGMMTQDKIAFLSRVQRQSILRNAAKGGIALAQAVIKNDWVKNNEGDLLQTSLNLYQNPGVFRDVPFGQARVDVGPVDEAGQTAFYGVTDEESRLNLNHADREKIRRLMVTLGVADEDEARDIASAIYDWRVYGESEIEGFSREDSYDHLEYPYPPRKANFETLDELRLVQGMTESLYEALVNYVTVYGPERLNINTVTWPVLVAYGLTQEQAKMVIAMRQGADGVKGTMDDYFFMNTTQLFIELQKALGVQEDEAEELRKKIAVIPLVIRSEVFRIFSRAQMKTRRENKSITCVFDLNGDKIIYWKEQ